MTILGNLVSWIVKEFDALIRKRLKDLPKKSSRDLDPFFYWVTVPMHSFFSKERNQLHIKFNLSLEPVIRTYDNMRVIKLKDSWNSKDSTLVINNKFSEAGMTCYWSAIDTSVKFNVLRRELFIAKQLVAKYAQKEDPVLLRSHVAIGQCGNNSDPMRDFFHQNAQRDSHRDSNNYVEYHMGAHEDFDRRRNVEYHMGAHEDFDRRRNDVTQRHADHRFILPHPRY